MELITILVIFFCVLYISSLSGLIVLMKWYDILFYFKWRHNRDKLVRCIFLMPNGYLKDDVFLAHDENDMVNYEDGEYQVVAELGFYSTKKNILTMVYTYRNPAPIDFNRMKKDNVPEYDASGLQKALQEKFIRDLLSEQNKMLLMLIMIIVNLAVTAIIGLKVFGVFDK